RRRRHPHPLRPATRRAYPLTSAEISGIGLPISIPTPTPGGLLDAGNSGAGDAAGFGGCGVAVMGGGGWCWCRGGEVLGYGEVGAEYHSQVPGGHGGVLGGG